MATPHPSDGSVYEPTRHGDFVWTREAIETLPGDQPLGRALRTWHELAGSVFAPVWTPEVILAMPSKLAGMTNVIDAGSGAPPFSYRFFGSRLAAMHSFELTNKTTDAIGPPAFRNLCVDQLSMTIAAREPYLFCNMIPTHSGEPAFEHLVMRLPFSADGAAVTQIMTLETVATSLREASTAFTDARAEAASKQDR